ncbi:MAG: hypothetical protein ACOC7K_02705 [bacterium]
MARRPKPWFRKGRGWFVQIEGKQHNLGPDKEQAFQRFHELMSRPEAPRVSEQHVAALLDLFLEWTKAHRAEATFKWYRERLQSFFKSMPPSMVASQLKPYHVQRWLDSHPTWSDGHRRGSIIAVQRAFRWATRMGYIDHSPIAHLEKPPAGTRDLIVSPERFDEILRHVHDPEFADLLCSAWETGARPQELFRVERGHVDLVNQR